MKKLTNEIVLHNDVSKIFIDLKSTHENVRHTFPGLTVSHSIHMCNCSLFFVLYLTN